MNQIKAFRHAPAFAEKEVTVKVSVQEFRADMMKGSAPIVMMKQGMSPDAWQM